MAETGADIVGAVISAAEPEGIRKSGRLRKAKAAQAIPPQNAARGRATGGPDQLLSAASEVWQARVGHEFSTQLLEDARLLGLDSKTEVVRAALELLHRQAAEVRMARSVDEFYGDNQVPLPAGVVPFDPSELDEDDAGE